MHQYDRVVLNYNQDPDQPDSNLQNDERDGIGINMTVKALLSDLFK